MVKKRVLILYLLILAVISYTASAAVIHGSLYDLNLDDVDNALVEINTEPKQQMVSRNSSYFFNVPLGEYTITAKKFQGREVSASAEENITVSKQGEFVLDMILFPYFGEEEQLLRDVEFDPETGLVEAETSYAWVALLIIAIVALFLIIRLKGKEIIQHRIQLEEEGSDVKKVIEFIKKEGGRTTQKNIRKHFPQSEAKISLIITELESEGRIKKIKKGRGNVIILK
jgi:uncharacterized membrane protein